MVKVKTKSGFEIEVNDKMLTDWRFVRAMKSAQSPNGDERVVGIMDASSLVLGANESALVAHLTGEDGSVPFDSMVEEISEIISIATEKAKDLKNS